MRIAFLSPALLIAASASATVTFNGITLNNSLSTVTSDSAIRDISRTVATQYLTDDSYTTIAYNLGTDNGTAPNGGVLEGMFANPVSANATHIYVLGIANSFPNIQPTPVLPDVYNGTFSIQLVLSSGLTSAVTYNSSNYVITTDATTITAQVNSYSGSTVLPDYTANGGRIDYVAYLPIAFSDFSASATDVLGIRFSNMQSPWLDISYIGTTGPSAVPEPSTYGLALGGLALVAVALKRRNKTKA